MRKFEEAVIIAANVQGLWISCCCPRCGGRKASCSVRHERSGYPWRVHCFRCGSRTRDFAVFLPICTSPGPYDIGTKPNLIEPLTVDGYKKKRIGDVWANSLLITRGDPADLYLRRRGIEVPMRVLTLRYSPNTKCHTAKGSFVLPAMLARVDSPTGEMVTLHVTYLSLDGKKADLGEDESAKRIMSCPFPGATKGGAIRLQPAGPVLCIAEGIETALACHLDTGLPVWSAISANGLRTFQPPGEVRELVIFADNDVSGVGQKAAQELAFRLASEPSNIITKVLVPPVQGQDWLDVYIDDKRISYD